MPDNFGQCHVYAVTRNSYKFKRASLHEENEKRQRKAKVREGGKEGRGEGR